MSPLWRRRILRLALGIYLIGMGFVMGVVVERWRFDGVRKAMLDRYNEVVRQVRTHQMSIELGDEHQ